MFERVKVAIAAVIAALALAVTPVVAGNGENDIPTFDAWLQGASGPLGSLIVGVALSFVVEWWPAYQSWPARRKRLSFFDPLVWRAIWQGVLAGGAGTAAHARRLPG